MTAAQPARPAFIGSLSGIRGVLAWMVVVIHIAPAAALLTPAVAPAWEVARLHLSWVLDLFFVLSGFVITYGYRDRFVRVGDHGRFLWARLARLYPVHLAVLAALVVAVLAGRAVGHELPHGGDLGWDLARHLTLTQGWGGARTLTWNGPTWSLSAEWFCYLITPVVVLLAVRLRTTAAVLAAYAVAMAVPLAVYGVIGFGDPQTTYIAPLWRAVGGFVGGALLCQIGHVGSALPAWLGRRTEALALALVVLLAGLAVAGLPTMWSLPVLGPVVLALAQQHGPLDRALSTPRAQAMGRMSLSLFLTHVPWLMAATLVITPARFPGLWGWVGIALLLAGALAIAWLVHRLVEDPVGRWMGGLAHRPAPQREPDAPYTIG